MRAKAWLAWSTGKDSAFALAEARRTPDVEVVGLVTTVSEAHRRVAMHGVREELLARQAEAVGLPVVKVPIPSPCPNEVYERRMAEALAGGRAAGVTHVVFGDLFLADLRAWREARLAEVGMAAVFPLWQRETAGLARAMVDAGVSARLTCVDPRKLDRSFAGRRFDAALLADLPAGVDPCGENGEFHTFATDGPAFRTPVAVTVGEVVERDGFVFADLLPA